MKATLEEVSEAKVEVELPEKCPACGADFMSEDELNLVEEAYVASAQGCRMLADGTLDDFDGGEYYVETSLTVGYKCACGHQLAGGF